MKHKQRLVTTLATLLLLAVSAQIEARDKILRGGLAYVAPTTAGSWETRGSMESFDSAFPPLGRFESTILSLFEASGDLGVGLGFETMLGDRFGIEAGVSYTRLVSEATHSGEILYTPHYGEPPAAAPERATSAAVFGGGIGRIDHVLASVGLNLHVLQKGRVDVYLGPLIGVAVESARFDSGEFRAVFSWVSSTPLAETREGREGFAWGGVVGIDVAVGGKGWLVSGSGRYVSTGSLNPSLIQVGIGYRF